MTHLCEGDWHGCYRGEYALQPAMVNAHPAKAAWGLAFRIVRHLEEIGVLREGDTVVDPMGGTGRFCLAALAQGYPAIAVELEERFIGFMQDSKPYAEGKLGRTLPWTILQGDARNLSTTLTERGLAAVTSPPYGDAMYGDSRKRESFFTEQYLRKVKMGDRSPTVDGKTRFMASHSRHYQSDYGATPGQIGALLDKPLKAVTSPPYGDVACHDLEFHRLMRVQHGRNPEAPHALGIHTYGATEGQLGQESGVSYLDAMRMVYAEIGKVADCLAIVIKDPTRNK